jgi:hypothetical protein
MRPHLETFGRWLWRGLILTTALVLLVGSRPDNSGEDYLYDSVIRSRRFNFVEWEAETLSDKALYSLAPPHTQLVDDEQQLLVLEFLELVESANRLQSEIASVYADPIIQNPDLSTAEARQRLVQTRSDLQQIQPLAEAVLQQQVATVLADQGIRIAGRVFPPVQLHFTPLPAMLVVSPRDRIEAIRFSALEPGLPIEEWIQIEDGIANALDVSTLVTPIGGLAAYPAMMYESSSITWVTKTGAHEWAHHYLTLHPLGVLYEASPALRTMNETVARIVGNEIGAEVIRRFYPEFAPPPAEPAESESVPSDQAEPDQFDFRAEMRETRLRVDELLAQDRIEEAEDYMERRRAAFWDQGYRIRKLNQAYFAFHGAYADEPGERGEDPVGPAVLELRENSASLEDFLQTIARLTSFEDLQQLLQG